MNSDYVDEYSYKGGYLPPRCDSSADHTVYVNKDQIKILDSKLSK